MKGKLIGIGVGPGDPELLTIKAYRAIESADVVVVPGKKVEESVAFKIVEPIYSDIKNKECMAIEMPMTKDEEILKAAHEKGAKQMEEQLEKGKNVVFLTLGDVTIYSTYLYIHRRVVADGFEAEIINGIPSFIAASAELNIGLVEKQESLHIIPASYDIEEALSLKGTKVLMKSGRQIAMIKKRLMELDDEIFMVENCGMDTQKIYYGAENIPEDAGYFSLIIVKERT